MRRSVAQLKTRTRTRTRTCTGSKPPYLQSRDDIDANSPLKSLRLKNLGRIFIGYLHINSIRIKIEALSVIVSHYLDI